MPTIGITSEMINQYFWPTFLHMIVPFLALITVFGIIRFIFARILRPYRTLRILADTIIVIAFLFIAGLIFPVVINSATFTVPESPDFQSLNQSIFDSVESAVRSTMEEDNSDLKMSSSDTSTSIENPLN